MEEAVKYFKSLYLASNPKIWFWLLPFLATSALFFVFFDSIGYSYLFPAFALGLLLSYLCLISPKLWIYLVCLSLGAYLTILSDDVTVFEMAIAAFHFGGLFIWLLVHVFVNKKKVIRNTGDLLIVLFFVISLFNFPIAVLNGVEPFNWFREYIIYLTPLLYFPFKELIKSREDILLSILFIGLSLIAVDLRHFYTYYVIVTSFAEHSWEFGFSMRYNLGMMTAGSLFSILMFFLLKVLKLKILSLLIFLLTTASLITSFARTFWLLFLIGLIILIVYLPGKYRIRLLSLILISTVVLVILGFTFFGDKLKFVYDFAEHRFSTIGRGTSDISLRMRVNEYESAIEDLKRVPFGGTGYAKEFSYYDIGDRRTIHGKMIHNGFLFIAYRVGIPLAIVYALFIFYFFFKSYFLMRSVQDVTYKFILLGSFLTILILIVSNLLTSQTFFKDGMFMMVFSFGFISIIEEKLNDGHLKLN